MIVKGALVAMKLTIVGILFPHFIGDLEFEFRNQSTFDKGEPEVVFRDEEVLRSSERIEVGFLIDFLSDGGATIRVPDFSGSKTLFSLFYEYLHLNIAK